MTGFWNNKNFSTTYVPNTDLLAHMYTLANSSSNAALGQAIGKTLTGLQQNISNANSAEYARQLETMSPLEVLQMEAKGIHPKTAKLGNGFIYNPEDQAVQNAYNTLKTNTQAYTTNQVNSAIKNLTDAQRIALVNNKELTPEGLLKLAGVNTGSAYTDPAALQTAASNLRDNIYSGINSDASDFYKSLDLNDPRQVRFWSGDNSYFTDKGYSPENSSIFGDKLRNDPQYRAAFIKRLQERYNAEQAKRFRNGDQVEAGDSWLLRNGYGNSKLHLDTFDYTQPDTAAALKLVQENERKVVQANALNKLQQAARDPNAEIPLDAFRDYMNSTNTEEAVQFLNSPEGRQALMAIKDKALAEIKDTDAWQTALSGLANPIEQTIAVNAINEQINNYVDKLGLRAYPEIEQRIKNEISAEGHKALQTYTNTSLSAANDKLKVLRDRSGERRGAMQTPGTQNLLNQIDAYLNNRSGYTSALDELDPTTKQRITNLIQTKFPELFGDMNSTEGKRFADILTRIIANNILNQNIDVAWSTADKTLLEYIKEGNNIDALYTPQESGFSTDAFTNADDVIISQLFGRNDKNKIAMSDTQKQYIQDFKAMVEAFARMDAAREMQSQLYPNE
jgi:uncharacterized protein YihD (DUF1040 family)